MPRERQIAVSAVAHAHFVPVWEVIVDAGRYVEWGPFDASGLEREGASAPVGVGAVRVLRAGRTTLREEVTAFAPGRHLDYRLLSGLPVSELHGRIAISMTPDGGTRITWGARLRPRHAVTGALVARRIEAFLADAVRALAGEAERREAVRAGDAPRPAVRDRSGSTRGLSGWAPIPTWGKVRS